jgi:tRNA pseudouridine32 synthase/23S rRNA pseudouridine746 synthase
MPEPFSPPADFAESPGGVAIVHVDRSLVVVDKPARLLSVPGRGADKQDCLIARVRVEFPDALIAHRLDYDTSGLLVLARGEKMQRALSRLFQERRVQKRYIAVVAGRPAKDEGEIDLPLNVDWPNRPLHKVDFESGKPALTRYQVLVRDARADAARLALTPETGRTHQLRVHLQAIGHPILGDSLYGGEAAKKAPRLLLHAERIAFTHPITGKPLEFTRPAPF